MVLLAFVSAMSQSFSAPFFVAICVLYHMFCSNMIRLLKRNFSTSRVQIIAPEIKKLRRNLDDHIVGQVSNYISPEIS